MNNGDTGSTFFLGLLVGTMVIMLATIIGSALGFYERIENAESIDYPNYTFIVTVDEQQFNCEKEPTIHSNGVGLVGCQELFGEPTLIKNYSSFSFKVKNVE